MLQLIEKRAIQREASQGLLALRNFHAAMAPLMVGESGLHLMEEATEHYLKVINGKDSDHHRGEEPGGQ